MHMIKKHFVLSTILWNALTNVVESGTGEYYGNACYWSNSYNLTWYPRLNITIDSSNTNTEYQYLYSPCNLSFYSTELDQHFAMKRYDLATGDVKYLIPELSNFPAKTDPNQPNTQVFDYEYENKSCPDSVQIVWVYWQCNETINNYPHYYNIISAGPLFDCFDSVFIQSPFACQDKSIRPTYKYDCSFTSNDKTVDLYTFIDSRSGKIDFFGYGYEFYPCKNELLGSNKQERPSKNNYAMLTKYTTDVYSTWDLLTANTDGDVYSYYYDPIINVWNFTFIGYNITRLTSTIPAKQYYCDVFQTHVLFGCDCMRSRPQYETVVQQDYECFMVLNVTRNDLCINYVNQCFPDKNNTDCVYYYRDNPSESYDKLNLSALTNTQIGYIENGGLYAFIYTPCNNNFLCGTDSESVSSMAGRKSINTNQCIEELGIFNGTESFIIQHEKGTTSWIIEYLNGAVCPTNPDEALHFKTTWKFQSYVEWKVNYVEFVEEDCLYDVSITTRYAGH